MTHKQVGTAGIFLLMAFGAACMTLGDFAVKQALLGGTSLQQVFGIGPFLFQILLILVAIFSKQGWRAHLPLRHPKLMFMRSLIGLCFTFFAFTSLAVNPYTQHAMLLQTGPAIASLLSLFILAEVFNKRILIVAAISLCGAALIIGPGAQSMSIMLVLPLLAATANAFANVMIARYRDKATGLSFTFWSSWIVAILGFAWWMYDGAPMPNIQGIGYIAMMAVLMALGLVCTSTAMSKAGSLGVASKVPLMMYVQTPVALFFGVGFLREQLTWQGVVGAAMILLAGIWLVLSKPSTKKSKNY